MPLQIFVLIVIPFRLIGNIHILLIFRFVLKSFLFSSHDRHLSVTLLCVHTSFVFYSAIVYILSFNRCHSKPIDATISFWLVLGKTLTVVWRNEWKCVTLFLIRIKWETVLSLSRIKKYVFEFSWRIIESECFFLSNECLEWIWIYVMIFALFFFLFFEEHWSD